MKKIGFTLRNVNGYLKTFKLPNYLKMRNQFINFKFSSTTTSNKLIKVIFPKPSETIDDGEILSLEKSKKLLFLEVGDYVKENETVMSIQTMKNAVEIRAPFNGIIKNHYFKIGDNVNCNTELFEIEQNDSVVCPKQAKSESISAKVDKISKKEEVHNQSEIKKTIHMDTSKNINNNIFEPKVDSSVDLKSTSHVLQKRTFDGGNSERMIISEPISSLRSLINEKMKFVQNEKAVLSTFNEVRTNFNEG